MRTARPQLLFVLLAALCGIMPKALADDPAAKARPAEPATPEQAPEPTDPVDASIKAINAQDNGLTIDRAARHVDVEAEVCLRAGEFLEMFACTRGTREHESILVLDTAPSMIHLGLLLLGAEPGKPLYYDRQADPPRLVPATGPEVEVFVVLRAAGQERQVPANRWIKDNTTEQMMAGNTWLFAGSTTTPVENQQVYLADLNGSAVSLVNFGDDLLTLPNAMTQDNASHGKVWAPRTRAIPKVGTNVTLRLRLKAPEQGQTPKPGPQAGPEAE